MFGKIFSGKIICPLLALFILAGCAQQFSGARPSFDSSPYVHIYNSPDINIYWTAKSDSNILTVRGAIQNIYYTDIINVHLYVDILDVKENVISSATETVIALEPEEASRFLLTFPLHMKPTHIRFSFLYDYAEWRGSVMNSGTFKRPLGQVHS